ncbi:MAG TPA: OmpA family protein [Gammaproteobacteria bacterium]|nr:OmpA family protein [Gammaproteobacteria bacterium]
MSYMIKKTAVALGLTLAVNFPAHAVDNLTVDGYARSSAGNPVTDSSGQCVRTVYEDSKEFLEKCGYKKVVTETVEVDHQPAGVGVAVVEETAIVEKGRVLAAKEKIVAEAFIQNLEFGFDSANLSASDKAELDGVIAKLDPYRPMLRANIAHLNVIGHTDSQGPESYNQGLSKRRAQAVADYLATVGNVDRRKMRVSGRGEAEPIGDNSTEEGRRLNRRVVIEVIKD